MIDPMITLGLIGWPLGHSLSPVLHQAALEEYDIFGSYKLFPIEPNVADDQIIALLEEVRLGNISGLNVTIPYKQTVIKYIHRLTEPAQAVGAVNTIYSNYGEIIGDNTDIEGFALDLKSACNEHNIILEKRGKALLLGAGGSARAVTYSLSQMGWQVIVAARRKSQAESLANDFLHFGKIEAIAWPLEDPIFLEDVSLIINTTPVGMRESSDESIWPEQLNFPSSGLLYDLVYNPVETTLMRQAKKAGFAAVSGIGMLVNQAALSFSIWLGVAPPISTMRAAIHEKISMRNNR